MGTYNNLAIGKNVKNIFFLTAVPPISILTPAQTAYHFISGGTAKVVKTEAGVIEPQLSFSACFGASFMPLNWEYAGMLNCKIKETGADVWLINTGCTGGSYWVGTRMKLKYTRAMISTALKGEFGLDI